MEQSLTRRSTLILLVTFALVIMLAIAGTIIAAFWHTSDALFQMAMQIIGLGGPAGSIGQSAADAYAASKTRDALKHLPSMPASPQAQTPAQQTTATQQIPPPPPEKPASIDLKNVPGWTRD